MQLTLINKGSNLLISPLITIPGGLTPSIHQDWVDYRQWGVNTTDILTKKKTFSPNNFFSGTVYTHSCTEKNRRYRNGALGAPFDGP